jgi:tetratricopeptide (TPR) repeat protein
MQRYREAEDQYKQAIERGPNYAYLYLNLGNLYLNQLHRQDDAERNFKKAIELHPDDRSYNMLGGFYELRGDLKLAEDNYRKGIAVDPKAVTARQNLARLLIDRNKKDEAEEALRTAVQIDPQNALSHLMFGQLLLDRGKLDEAEAEFLFLASTNPNDPQVLELLGDLHVKQKRFDEAIREYQQAAQLIPDPVMRAKIDRKLKAAEKQK